MCGSDPTEVLPATWRRAAEGLRHLEDMAVDACSDAEPGSPPGDTLAATLRSPSGRPRGRSISFDQALIPVQLPTHGDFTRSRNTVGSSTLALAFAAIVSLAVFALTFL